MTRELLMTCQLTSIAIEMMNFLIACLCAALIVAMAEFIGRWMKNRN